jgi:serine/threonine protein kinase
MQVVTNLMDMHDHRVMHGDIKPGNVLIKGSSGSTGLSLSAARPRGALNDFGTAQRIPDGEDKVKCK